MKDPLMDELKKLAGKYTDVADSLDLEKAYSYPRGGSLLTAELAEALLDAGHSPTKTKAWIYGKVYRHALDGRLGDAIKQIAVEYVRGLGKGKDLDIY